MKRHVLIYGLVGGILITVLLLVIWGEIAMGGPGSIGARSS